MMPNASPEPKPHASILQNLARALVKAYRLTLSPLIGFNCRHLPTCSQYADEAIARHGFWAGGWMTLARLLRCHPLGTSGLDFVTSAPPPGALLVPAMALWPLARNQFDTPATIRRIMRQRWRFKLPIDLDELLEPERGVRGTEFRGFAIPLARLGRVGVEINDTEPLQHVGIIGSTKCERCLRIVVFGRPAQHQSRRSDVAGGNVGARPHKQGGDLIAIQRRNSRWRRSGHRNWRLCCGCRNSRRRHRSARRW